jgi:hypothetical protein
MSAGITRRVASREASPGESARATPLEFLAQHNVLYILSALLMLIGCLLISLPRPFRLIDLVVLLIVINLYEAMVIAVVAWITRRSGASREANVLILVETAFLLDAHFTVNACVTADGLWGPLLAAIALAFAFAKVYLISRLSGGRVFAGVKRVLLPAVIFAHAFQVVLVLARTASPMVREVSTFALWLSLGALPLLLMCICSQDCAEGRERETPWWRTPGFARTVGALAILVPLVLLAGQTWAHNAPFSLAMLLPLVFSLLVAAPVLLPKVEAVKITIVRVAATIVVLMIAALAGDFDPAWRLGAGGIVLSPLRVGLVFGGAVFLLAFARERKRATWDIAFVPFAAAALGHDAQNVVGALYTPTAWQAGAVGLLAFIWWLKGRSFERALAASGIAILFAARAAEGAWPSMNTTFEFVRWMPVAALAISAAYDVRARRFRRGLFMAVFALGAGGMVLGGVPSLVYCLVAFAALGSATLRGGRPFAFALASYPFISAAAYWRMLPRTSGEWGAMTIACAFAALACAMAVTHLRIGKRESSALREGDREGGGV